MHTFDEMKAYVRFSEADAARLRDLWPHVEPQVRHIADLFYDRILEFEGARTVFADAQQVRRLKRTLQVWLEELHLGPHDLAYYERRRRIGDKHVAVGLPHHYMFTAMALVQQQLCGIAHDALPDDEADAVCEAARKATMLDLAIMTGEFMGQQVASRVQDLATVLVSHLPSATFLLDADGVVREATGTASALCGGSTVGEPLTAVLPEGLVATAELETHMADALRHRRDVEIPRVDADVGDDLRSFRVLVTPLTHAHYRLLVVVDELTSTVRQETRLRRNEALVQMGSMSAAVAHELRNPLAGISGAVQVIATSFPEDDPRRGIMGKVRDQIRRLDRTVKDLLAFARPNEARLHTVDLAEVVDVVIELVQRDVPGARVERVGRGRALADADLVHRILINLVQNGLAEVSEKGRVEIHVADGQIIVCDDGDGVPEDLHAKLFEPFFTTKTTGTGLGLAICRNAAEAMGAELELVEGAALKGAAFRLRFAMREVS